MEKTLFNRKGAPVAYITGDTDQFIYSFSGNPHCYILQDTIFTIRGKHIGWFEDEIVYDIKGRRVGYTQTTCPSITFAEPAKQEKTEMGFCTERYIQNTKPEFCRSQSNLSLTEFLAQ